MPSQAKLEMILGSLSLEQKITLLSGDTFSATASYPEKNVPSIKIADGPNGVRAPATSPDVRSACFPAACSLAATFDVDLARRFGRALAAEARQKNVNCILGPTVCIHRHPLGGRNFESFSEDPFLAGKMASQVIQGLQEKGVAATIKHFAANEQETSRASVDESISERALREIYLRPFEIAIKEANPWAVMTAYNLVNGTHCDSHTFLLRDILRGNWGWDGLVMSDWGGTNSVADALRAGLDLEMPGPPKVRKPSVIKEFMQRGELSEDIINDRARAVLRLALKLENLEKSSSSPIDRQRTEHNKLIRQSGAYGMVLLKNEEGILPLSKEKVKGRKIALIGYAKDVLAHGGGSASVNAYYKVTPEEGLRTALGDDVEFIYAKGAHRERLLIPLYSNELTGKVVGANGASGFTLSFFDPGKENAVITRHGFVSSAYSPLGSSESYQKVIELLGYFTPTESGKHYISCSGFGPTQVYLDEELIFEQEKSIADPMGCLFNAAPEPEVRYQFTAGKTYRIRIRSEPPLNLGIEILEGRSGARLGFSPVAVHDADLQGEAVRVAKEADCAVIFTGHDSQWETEGQDQASFCLPHHQNELVTAVAAVNKNVIVINSTGVAVAMPWLDKVKGLIQAWFPGQEYGNAVADVITGVVNPEGHLPVSFPRYIEDAPAHGNFPGEYINGKLKVNYAEGVFVGYRHYDRMPREKLNFPFGHGLSYTTFVFRNLKIQTVNRDTFNAVVDVANNGPVSGRVLIQLYVGKMQVTGEHPVKTLVAFKKVRLETGQTKTVDVSIEMRDFAYFEERKQKWMLDEGEYELSVGLSSAEIAKSVRFFAVNTSWDP
ncbi:beta-glucosidase B [Aspergillus parasiticus]|uniref:beta-glucosidase n=1 Tax=Aspergillus parasiticus TaxID=5067 RepID=A0A5N6D4K6_ASPPA|nr:beta-glucosidase B [Aspergillus parasiticus]